MSSPCTRLVRCRVKDLASCFYACRFPLDEESSDAISSSFPPMQNASSSKISVANKICNEEEKGETSAQSWKLNNSTNHESESVEEGSRDSKWPRFSEEDYIVFCFREDGAIHMINENKPSKTYDHHDNSKKGHEKEWSNNEMMESHEWTEDEIKEMESATNIGAIKACEEDSFESCNSNQSDTSTNSFSFPKLGVEWIGSPVHMPKSEKHKATSLLLHCCRF
ncbi:protein BREAKING OF ASYMMETRY IN THE STOMATAL LINEAGE [Henckelia pumila]|uniref:protein BREAKING OF ASYMMETRY IN THE STOMATAL LINEAGE n=1 Tax=Henckelia pumila TaxID=405737 RepID=UPI003C6DDB2F